MIFIRSTTKNKRNTLLLTKKVTNCTFICAIGYGDGDFFEEFCGKFYWDDEADAIIGFCTNIHDPDEWEKKICGEDIMDNVIRAIGKSDKDVINIIVNQIWAEYLTYDEKTETRLIRDKYASKTKVYKSEDWFPDIVDLISNYHWELGEKFDY